MKACVMFVAENEKKKGLVRPMSADGQGASSQYVNVHIDQAVNVTWHT